jgi:Zn finger protein HypA/HybF involved in hydrogenase expression
MGAKSTKEEFVAKAIAKHGIAYTYAAVDYLGSSTPVQITCSTHGAFMQSPSNHLAGKGCRKCASQAAGDRYRKSGDSFIEQARSVHGDLYDYSEAEYKTARLKVAIRCKVHGLFRQVPYVHLKGAGCPLCGNEAIGNALRSTLDQFIQQAREKYGAKFDYKNAQYVDANTPLAICCPVHGHFVQSPTAHIQTTYGCPECASDDASNRGRGPRAPRPQDRLGTVEFVARATAKHSGKYDYSRVDYKTSKDKVTIVCPTHGEFLQDASSHLSGKGCPKCRSESNAAAQRQPVEAFIARSQEVHGQKFDYSKVDYKTARLPVTIICPVHGEFQQVPDMHIKSGCRLCADDELPGAYSLKVLSRDPALAARPAVLYYLHFESVTGERFYKIGITLKSIKQRFAGYGAAGYTFTVLGEKKLPLMEAFQAEQTLVSAHVKTHHYSPLRGNREKTTKFGGRKECFSAPLPDSLVKLFD